MATEPEEPTTQSLQSQYAAQFADHLTDNREEQARLRKRLEQLEADEAWLVKALGTVSAPAEDKAGSGAQTPEGEPAPPQDNTSGPTEPTEATDVETSAAVPKQRQDQSAKMAAKKTTAKKTAVKETTAKKATAKKPGAKKTTAKQAPAAKKTAKQAPAAKTGEPSLGELLLSVLGQHAGQPRTAGEVTVDLEQGYPERARDINTVRNTLERLVAKSRIERTKQKNTVLYTAVTEPADDAVAEASPAAETAGAAETAKVPAQA